MKVLSLFAVVAALPSTAAYIMPGSPEWIALEQSGGFDDLRASLSAPEEILIRTIQEDWRSECSSLFAAEGFPTFGMTLSSIQNGSNYELFEQPSGLCQDSLSCVYAGCFWPFDDGPSATDAFSMVELNLPNPNLLNLPAYVVRARTVGDIVATVAFCNQHDIQVSVKTTGHSFLGSSTSKGSILVHMADFPKYADVDNPNWSSGGGDALIQCPSSSNMDVTDICNLANARNVLPTALRVGGGQIWDEVYRAVRSLNINNPNSTQYHIVGAAAGTVSAAGGWLSGGGLGATAGMRLYGFGVDQILQMEMVLANGWHVRFGPSASSTSTGFPQTTAVRGECNLGSLDEDESLRDWQPCPDENSVDFADLWYAVRGGAAGYGVVTAAVYQLHDKPGQLDVAVNLALPETLRALLSPAGTRAVIELWMNFLIDFFFDPVVLGVTELESNSCGSPQVALSMDPFTQGTVFCFNNAGPAMVNAWTNVVAGATATLRDDFGVPDAVLDAMGAAFIVAGQVDDFIESYFSILLAGTPSLGNGVPPGRMPDNPKPYCMPTIIGLSTCP